MRDRRGAGAAGQLCRPEGQQHAEPGGHGRREEDERADRDGFSRSRNAAGSPRETIHTTPPKDTTIPANVLGRARSTPSAAAAIGTSRGRLELMKATLAAGTVCRAR
jgi:hypothetical protein